MERKARSQELSSVSKSLGCDPKSSSDQGAVWASIDALNCKAQTNSPTSAMHDVFATRREGLQEALLAFQLQPQQNGFAFHDLRKRIEWGGVSSGPGPRQKRRASRCRCVS
jgi:hypothetical protein